VEGGFVEIAWGVDDTSKYDGFAAGTNDCQFLGGLRRYTANRAMP
jgi:hypothetical protein